MEKVLENILRLKKNNQKAIAILIDPDNLSRELLIEQVELAKINSVDFFFIGGSMITEEDCLEETLDYIKSNCDIPTVIFPGSVHQVSNKADAILFLSLISGRNPDLLIGNHVLSAPTIKKSGIEVIPTGYMLIDGGKPTTASYVSNSFPIPNDKPKIAGVTALAGEMLGLRLNFLDAGSGAVKKVSKEMIQATAEGTANPLIVGGGIKTAQGAKEAWDSGATIVVIGNAIETDPNIIKEVSKIKCN
ncbi:MAG: geranylgeranylglyceryl/heptaprenylglyceryl phosphate synthase [Flavobacteriales bacterium]